jgi:histidinol-phosphate phosphatase family protein
LSDLSSDGSNTILIPSTAVILAGGTGSRLGQEAQVIPKPMVDISGLPLLVRQLQWLDSYGIKRVYLLTGHLTHVIEEYFQKNPPPNIDLQIVQEKEPMGTAGALGQLRSVISEPFWVIYGDLLAWLSLDFIYSQHLDSKTEHTIVVHPNDHPHDSDLVVVDGDSFVQGFLTKPHPPDLVAVNLVNAAVYLLSPKIFKYISEDFRGDIARDIFPKFVERERVLAFKTSEYVKDMGTPDRLASVRKDWESGKVKRFQRLSHRPAVFLDRDGVIIEYVPDIHRQEDIKLRAGAATAIRQLNQVGFLVIVVTNQPMIAKGLLTEHELSLLHAKMETLLGAEGAWLDRIYYCPHHPDSGFPGERQELKVQCDCRKPATGMLKQAVLDFKIDLANSWIVGDTWRDSECGFRFGISTLGIGGGEGYPYATKQSSEPKAILNGLEDAASLILSTIAIED